VRLALAAAAAAALVAPSAGADSLAPIRVALHVAPVARLHKPLTVAVTVAADPSVLDNRFAPLRIEVRLAGECGGSFETTPGAALVDKLLSPQPVTERAYYAVAGGAGRPGTYGVKTVCTYLEEEGDNRVWAHDESLQVDVSRPCTLAAARYDRARRHGVGRRALRLHRRAARRACGPGVPL
jgi:hypothetical protein